MIENILGFMYAYHHLTILLNSEEALKFILMFE